MQGYAVAQLIGATSQKIAGSIPADAIRIFYWLNPCGRPMALGFTQPITEMSTKNISSAPTGTEESHGGKEENEGSCAQQRQNFQRGTSKRQSTASGAGSEAETSLKPPYQHEGKRRANEFSRSDGMAVPVTRRPAPGLLTEVAFAGLGTTGEPRVGEQPASPSCWEYAGVCRGGSSACQPIADK